MIRYTALVCYNIIISSEIQIHIIFGSDQNWFIMKIPGKPGSSTPNVLFRRIEKS